MTYLFYFVLIFNALFFIFYGLQCFTSLFMIDEFRRFGLPDSQRILTGILQLLGAAGLFTGLIFPVLGLLSSAGLSLMMLIAFFSMQGIELVQIVPNRQWLTMPIGFYSTKIYISICQ